MEWLSRLQGTVVGIDTAPLIYFVEENPAYLALVDPLFDALARGEFQSVTSTLTLAEVLVHPYRRGDQALATRYSLILLHATHLKAVPVSAEIASDAARLRATYRFKTPDSIQLATARIAGASTFVTNDAGLKGIANLDVIVLDNLISRT